MAYNDEQNEFPVPVNGDDNRKSERHLPRYFRTQVNSKFLASTLDQLLQPGVAEKLNGYVGRKTAKAFQQDDVYVGDISNSRESYQLEPVSVITDELGNIEFYKDYNDYINQIANFNGNVDDHSLLNSQEYYAWNPHIDWDKFVNFREYYWLPNGPQTIDILGQSEDVISTYSVTLADNVDNYAYVFSPDGVTQNPTLKLYRGVTYRFEINTPGLPLTFRTKRTLDDSFLLDDGISSQTVESGVIEITLGLDAPNTIYYVADNDINASGLIKVANIEEASFIDVEAEVLGKKTYTSGNNITLSNGMKIKFQGEVVPEKYSQGEWYVEGVGDKIVLIEERNLNVASTFADTLPLEFDNEGFDRLPFDEAIGYPVAKDYILINRASKDGNLWSRYNRWFHKSVIETSAAANNQPITVDESQRAKRPIIEFQAGLKLFNFGTFAKTDVDLVDDFTVDVFSTIEGTAGYNVDGVDITEGMRILFTADTDPLVKNKLFEVKFINFSGNNATNRQLTLTEVVDTDAVLNETLLVRQGNTYRGKTLFFNGSDWKTAQVKNSINQSPLFDIFDENGVSYSDSTVYDATTFTGTKVFSYKLGSGPLDSELNLPLSYRTIENVGDITFNFDLLQDSFTYQIENNIFTRGTNIGFLRRYSSIDSYVTESGWTKAETPSNQPVIRQYVFDNTSTKFNVDVYENSAELSDLWLRVYLNNSLMFENVDYITQTSANNELEIVFTNSLTEGDVVVIKTRSSAQKTDQGYYEVPPNFEKNPLNVDLSEFTLGEVNDHVATIVEEYNDFQGIYPGVSNLRDAGLLYKHGKRFLKHSSPLNLSLYHTVDKEANIIKSLRYARREYGKFKRLFLQTASTLGFEGPVKQHVDKILEEIVKDKTSSMPFYFSDMVPLGAAKRTRFEIEDADSQNFFALSTSFSLASPSRKSVQVYLNEEQLTHNKDYTFTEEGFVFLTVTKEVGDFVDIYEYETTNGSYIPPTPTKLGLYPAYEPAIYVDNTYLEPTKVIQGHDGSIVIAFDDYRDNLLLELERRIFNNIKVAYDVNYVDIHNFVGGEHRNTEFSESVIDKAMLADFIQWTQLVDDDYTENNFFQRSNTFTWNYSAMSDPSGNPLLGFWRAIYKKAYDTDRPHTHPWEMLGFSIKPAWWETQYGPAPYTKDNLLLWEDLEKGIIREPGKKFVVNKKYVRPGLLQNLPVDEDGNLLSPAQSGYAKNYITTNIQDSFEFGDQAPVETAWRKSSEYPFALLTSWALTQPSTLFSVAFDRIRQVRNVVGEIVYSPTMSHIRLEDLVFPNTNDETVQTFTSGLVNYIAGYMASNVTAQFKSYQSKIKKVQNQIGFKLGGFTDKSKFKLILDSRTPLNQGNVFIPEENYKIFLNTSTPVVTVNYSGVIIEKQTGGFIIRGYDQQQPTFKYFRPIALDNDPVINVGGVTEGFIVWDDNKSYIEGQNVEYEGAYYRVKESHTSGPAFDASKFSKLASLPLTGGRDAIFKRTFFKRSAEELSYGTQLRTVQDVVDFLLGYEEYLKSLGFVFDYFDEEDELVNDWKKSAKEFMFWTTQNWSAGTVISLSPVAKQLKFNSEYSTVDNIFDSFYGYTLYKADGKKLVEEFSSLSRQNPNEFILKPKNTADGIYAVKLPLVQKEHVVLLDNKTVFGDVIYDLEPGYRQERIRVLGYRTADWDGSLNIPGFIYDEAKVTEWEPWKDYAIGELVKYKEFFYAAETKISGKETFDSTEWNRLSEKPETGLLTNFEYKVNQFADFYDLDTDNFDVEQQRFAQHLIGYQNRNYLANIINDDVSQYKFYQGMIADKGTKNSLTKLFDVLGSAEKDSLEFYEEWAIKSGQYGAADGFDEVEFLLDEDQFRLSPQPVELVQRTTGQETDLIYRIRPFEVYQKTENYDHSPFPSKYIFDGYTKNSGYVNPEDVQHIVENYDSISNIDFKTCKQGDYIWVGNDNLSWNVYKHIDTDLLIESVEGGETEFTVVLNSTPTDIQEGEILGVFDLISTEVTPEDSTYPNITQTTAAIGSFYKVKDVILNKITLETSEKVEDIEQCKGKISKLISARVQNLAEANQFAQNQLEKNDIIWLDDDDQGRWTVLKNINSFTLLDTVSNNEGDSTDQEYGVSLATNELNTVLAVGAPANENGKVFVYKRNSNSQNWKLSQILEPDTTADSGQRFGEAVAVSQDGRYIAVGSPSASNVKTDFKGAFSGTENYNELDIVSSDGVLWKALVDIQGAVPNIIFGSFNSVAQNIDDLNIEQFASDKLDVLLTGNYPFTDVTTDHLIVRAPADMYEGSAVGDQISLKWNTLTSANQDQLTLTTREPFDGAVPGITSSLITNKHTIVYKIDTILYVDAGTNIPVVGDRVEVPNAFGIVEYRYFEGSSVTLYLKDVNGVFPLNGSLFLESGDFVGEFERSAPFEENNYSDVYNGYWVVNTNEYTVSETTTDQGRGLIYVDVIPQSQIDPNRYYYNILDFNTQTISSQNTLNSYIRVLSYQGAPGAGGNTEPFISDLYVVRAPKALTDTINIVSPGSSENSKVDMFMPLLQRYYVDLDTPLLDDELYYVYRNGIRIDDPFFGTDLQTNNNAELSSIVGDGITDRIFFEDLGIDIGPTDFLEIKFSRTLTNVVATNIFGNVLQDVNLTYEDFNKTQTVYDLWDGYINFDFTILNPSTGAPYEPRVGDTVEDVTTGARAVITYYQRNSLNATIFVRNVTGTWSQGNEFGDNAEIRYLGTPGDPNPDYRVDQIMGQIQFRSLGFDSAGIGKLLVIKNRSNISLPEQDILLGNEYWFYLEGEVAGVERPANIPGPDNNDWEPVFNIPASPGGTPSGLSEEGLYSIYQLEGSVNYSLLSHYTVPQKTNNFYLGSQVKLTQFNDLYRLFVQATGDLQITGDDENYTTWGRIYFVKQGIDEFGNTWSWEYARDKNYAGEFSINRSYSENDIVFRNGELFRAQTNISAGLFNTVDWALIEESQRTEYVGYIPNDTGLLLDDDSSSILTNTDDLLEFATDFDVSKNGEVLVVSNRNRNTAPNEILVYRSFNGNYLKSQTILAPNNTIGFGDSISISADGMLIAIGAPEDDARELDQGQIYIYKQINGTFVQSQVLNSRSNESAEFFGDIVDFDGNTLIVGSRNADSFETTTFDSNQTVFDNNFTKYRNYDKDSGVVYVYERINDTLIFAQTLSYNDDLVDYFGRNILVTKNHIYVGLPRYASDAGKQGSVANYRRLETQNVWETLRSPKDTVDINSIKRVILYDTKENQLLQYLDYIDPVQGKIAGPAEQEISFKTYYDPATYTTGTQSVDVDKLNSWGQEHVGRVWWDLTNAKFLNAYQGNIIFSSNNWNTLFASNTIDVYEWVETDLLPSEWDAIADTEQGIVQGISGKSRYGDQVYAQRRVYDSVAQSFSNKYYFWVKDKTTVPNFEWRSMSIRDIADLITNPAAEGYRFINFISPNSFVLHNCDSLIKGTDVALSVQYWTLENQSINIHNQYQILTDGLEASKPNKDIERKWFDSLIGYDSQFRTVPSPEISAKERYGILNKPRQSWFVNKTEAFKQLITRVNDVLIKNLIIDSKDISPLFESDPKPTVNSKVFDTTVDSVADLEFVGVARAERAVLIPVIENGKIVRVNITNAGRGYLTAPTVTIAGQGNGAVIETEIDSLGKVISATVTDQGNNYNDSTILTVRRFTVLVNNDETIQGKWSLYERVSETRSWQRIESQGYDVSLYWDYVDWYEDGYSDFTDIDFLVDQSYELQSLENNIGDIVKISNIGSGGWLLLEKIDEQDTPDYTINYKTVGRQNGTIRFKDSLYDIVESAVGYDAISFDTKFFDSQPIIESRIVLETLRDNIFVNDLALEYNKLFFASLRYVFSEQGYVDWAFKTSFVKAKHNVGELRKDITFNNDNLPSYEDYLNEVKPYKTKLREYLSSYEKIDNSQSMITDFDLSPAYNNTFKTILPQTVKVVDNTIIGIDNDLQTYPNKHWLDNLSYSVISVEIANGGTGYTSPPKVTFTGGGGSGAEAYSVIGTGGVVTSIVVTNSGTGYLSAPSITLEGSQTEDGQPARVSVILGDNLVRSMHTVVKFDRISGTFQITKLAETQTFIGTGSKYIFELTWPMDLRNTVVEVTIDGNLSLSSEYSYYNVKDTSKGYDRYFGTIEFTIPPAVGKTIVVNYRKSINLLNAQDRVNLFYNPTSGMFSNDLSQLMDGVDYGGVEVRSFEFSGITGWDTDSWFNGLWDSYDTTYDDEIFELDGSTLALELSKPLANDVVYNVYKNNVRIDDPNFNTPEQTNPNALLPSITGDGEQQTINLGDYDISANSGDIFVVRRIDSDGSFLPSPDTYDTLVQGGNLAYTTATGLNAEDIRIDGDGFVTPTTSKGPEETVPGQVIDTVDIQIYERPTGGGSFITSRNYIGDGVTKTFDIGSAPIKEESLFVKIGYSIQDISAYTIDYEAQQITFNTAPSANTKVNLITLGQSGERVLDIDTFIGDGSTNNFLTNVRWNENVNYYATINGESQPSILIESDNTYAVPNNIVISFAEPPPENSVIRFALFEGTEQVFSAVTIDEFEADGSTTSFELSEVPFESTPSNFYTIVKVNDKILNAGYNEIFEVTTTREYQLKLWQIPTGTINANEVEVYLNGTQLQFIQDWSFEGFGAFDPSQPLSIQAGSTVILANGVGQPGDELRVFILSDGEYRFGYFETQDDSSNAWVETPGVIQLDSAYNSGDQITVYQFSNHNPLGIDRQNYDIVERTPVSAGIDPRTEVFVMDGSTDSIRLENILTQGAVYNVFLNNVLVDTFIGSGIRGEYNLAENDIIVSPGDVLKIQPEEQNIQADAQTASYFEIRQLRNGLIPLRSEAIDAQYVWVVRNGNLLIPSVDYIVTENKRYIKLTDTLDEDDVIETIHFANVTLKNKFGWRQFKDMLNRTAYHRLDGSKNYTLTKDLQWYDKTIVLSNASNLPNPENNRNPGVIFVNGERIEYFVKDGNELKQLRRGTLGTGVPTIHPAGSEIYDQSRDSIMPYKDEIFTTIFDGDETTNTFSLDFTPNSVDDFEVFVGGKRLRKNSISSYRFEYTDNEGTVISPIAQDSPEGDITLPAEFSVEGNILTLTNAPGINQKVIIVRKVGKLWTPPGTPLSSADTDIGRFLRARTVDLPR